MSCVVSDQIPVAPLKAYATFDQAADLARVLGTGLA